MKKCLNFIIAALIVLVVAPGVVFADDGTPSFNYHDGDSWGLNDMGDVDLVVGSSAQNDNPVYAVSIKWDNLEYDWVYNSETEEYEWAVSGGNETYIQVTDQTTNGYLTPSLSYSSYSDYQFTKAHFYYKNNYSKTGCQLIETREELEAMLYLYKKGHASGVYEGGISTSSSCNSFMNYADAINLTVADLGEYYGDFGIGYNFSKTDFEGVIPTNAMTVDNYGWRTYKAYLELGVDRTQLVHVPKSGEKIGYFTLTLSTH